MTFATPCIADCETPTATLILSLFAATNAARATCETGLLPIDVPTIASCNPFQTSWIATLQTALDDCYPYYQDPSTSECFVSAEALHQAAFSKDAWTAVTGSCTRILSAWISEICKVINTLVSCCSPSPCPESCEGCPDLRVAFSHCPTCADHTREDCEHIFKLTRSGCTWNYSDGADSYSIFCEGGRWYLTYYKNGVMCWWFQYIPSGPNRMPVCISGAGAGTWELGDLDPACCIGTLGPVTVSSWTDDPTKPFETCVGLLTCPTYEECSDCPETGVGTFANASYYLNGFAVNLNGCWAFYQNTEGSPYYNPNMPYCSWHAQKDMGWCGVNLDITCGTGGNAGYWILWCTVPYSGPVAVFKGCNNLGSCPPPPIEFEPPVSWWPVLCCLTPCVEDQEEIFPTFTMDWAADPGTCTEYSLMERCAHVGIGGEYWSTITMGAWFGDHHFDGRAIDIMVKHVCGWPFAWSGSVFEAVGSLIYALSIDIGPLDCKCDGTGRFKMVMTLMVFDMMDGGSSETVCKQTMYNAAEPGDPDDWQPNYVMCPADEPTADWRDYTPCP